MFFSKICFKDSVQRSFPKMCFKDFVSLWDSRSGPPAFGSLWYVVEQYDGTTWNTICYYDASRNQTLATKSRKSIERRMWVNISQLCQLCCSQLWPMHVQKDFVQWHVQDFVQWSFRICCSKSFSKKVRAIQLTFSCCHFDSNTSSNSKLRKEKIPREH